MMSDALQSYADSLISLLDDSLVDDYRNQFQALINDLYTADDMTPIGTMTMIAHDTIPVNWLLCEGTTVYNRVDYPELYALLTNFHIDGDTFNLPNMSNRFPLSHVNLGEAVGIVGGSQTALLDLTNIPPHTHIQTSRGTGGANVRLTGDANGNATVVNNQPTLPSGGQAGQPLPFSIMPSYMRLKFIIKAQ